MFPKWKTNVSGSYKIVSQNKKNLVKNISKEVTDEGEKDSKLILYHWSLSVPIKTSANRRFSDVFSGYRKRPVILDGLMGLSTEWKWKFSLANVVKGSILFV